MKRDDSWSFGLWSRVSLFKDDVPRQKKMGWMILQLRKKCAAYNERFFVANITLFTSLPL
jgi:hypothetical protein